MLEKRMTRRNLLRSAALLGATLVAACAEPKIVEVEKVVTREVIKEVEKEVVKRETVVVKETVEVQVRDVDLPFKYARFGTPFDGKPIKLSYWNYQEPLHDFWVKWFGLYAGDYPNVAVDVIEVPYDKMWEKLRVAIPAGEAPDMFYLHQDMFHWTGVMGGLVRPFPEEMFPPVDVKKTFVLLDSWSGPEGKIYWIPSGTMQPSLYYNLDIFEEAGLSKADLPKSWDQLIELAKDLTQRDSAGRVQRSGFNLNGRGTPMVEYQFGKFIWPEDYAYPCYYTEEAIKGRQFQWDVNHTYKLCDDDFLSWIDAFTSGMTAMTYAFTWFTGHLKQNAPQLNYGVAPIPSVSGEFAPALAWSSPDPQSPAVPISTPPDRAMVCFDATAWLFSRPDFLIDMSRSLGTPPNTPQLNFHPLLKSDPVLTDILEAAEWSISGRGGAPLAQNAWNQVASYDNWRVHGGMPPVEDLMEGAKEAKRITEEYRKEVGEENFYVFEHNYLHADLMDFPDCSY